MNHESFLEHLSHFAAPSFKRICKQPPFESFPCVRGLEQGCAFCTIFSAPYLWIFLTALVHFSSFIVHVEAKYAKKKRQITAPNRNEGGKIVISSPEKPLWLHKAIVLCPVQPFGFPSTVHWEENELLAVKGWVYSPFYWPYHLFASYRISCLKPSAMVTSDWICFITALQRTETCPRQLKSVWWRDVSMWIRLNNYFGLLWRNTTKKCAKWTE